MPRKKDAIARVDNAARPKNLRSKAWDQNKPPGGELPVADEPPQNPAPPSKDTKSPGDKK